MESRIDAPNVTASNNKDENLAYWKDVNKKCCEYDSILGAGAWMEADKLDGIIPESTTI